LTTNKRNKTKITGKAKEVHTKGSPAHTEAEKDRSFHNSAIGYSANYGPLYSRPEAHSPLNRARGYAAVGPNRIRRGL